MIRKPPLLVFSLLLHVFLPEAIEGQECLDRPHFNYKCSQLAKYCKYPQATRIRSSCPITCGTCSTPANDFNSSFQPPRSAERSSRRQSPRRHGLHQSSRPLPRKPDRRTTRRFEIPTQSPDPEQSAWKRQSPRSASQVGNARFDDRRASPQSLSQHNLRRQPKNPNRFDDHRTPSQSLSRPNLRKQPENLNRFDNSRTREKNQNSYRKYEPQNLKTPPHSRRLNERKRHSMTKKVTPQQKSEFNRFPTVRKPPPTPVKPYAVRNQRPNRREYPQRQNNRRISFETSTHTKIKQPNYNRYQPRNSQGHATKSQPRPREPVQQRNRYGTTTSRRPSWTRGQLTTPRIPTHHQNFPTNIPTYRPVYQERRTTQRPTTPWHPSPRQKRPPQRIFTSRPIPEKKEVIPLSGQRQTNYRPPVPVRPEVVRPSIQQNVPRPRGSLERPQRVSDAAAKVQLESCCRQHKISPNCQGLCNYKITKQDILAKAVTGACSIEDAKVWVGCVAGGQKNAGCCRGRGATGCDHLCNGQFPPSFNQLLQCVNNFMPTVLQCHRMNLQYPRRN